MASRSRGGERIALRVVQAVLVTVAVLGAPYTLIGVAAISCEPDAYECPV
jgi:hypothetical protein